jgi:hypothetical protein
MSRRRSFGTWIVYFGDSLNMDSTRVAKKEGANTRESHISHRSFEMLVADDSCVGLIRLERTLCQAQDSVLSAKRGREATELFEEHHPPIGLTDWLMPDFNRNQGQPLLPTHKFNLRNRSQSRRQQVQRHWHVRDLTGICYTSGSGWQKWTRGRCTSSWEVPGKTDTVKDSTGNCGTSA